MLTYVKIFLATEITVIPQIMDRFIGKYYNNALYNAITWMILILHIIHMVFDLCVNALLKKMRFKEYLRIRLKKSLWYLGFYACSFLYCGATIWKNSIKFPNKFKFHVLDFTEPLSGHLILGYALLSAFFAGSSMWEGLQCSLSSFTYLFLTGFLAFTYFLRYIELAILLASTFSVIHVMNELTRCLFCVIKGDLVISKRLLVKFAFVTSLVTFVIVYFIIIPVGFIVPLCRGFLKNPNSVIMASLNLTLWGWLICEIYCSPLFRLIQHRWYHGNDKKRNKVPNCLGSVVECALFLPRDDVAYNLKIIKQEIKEREAKMMALRKPKNGASMLFQTLKCVAVINRKIKYKKLQEQLSAHSSSQNDSKSENKITHNINCSNTLRIVNDETINKLDIHVDENSVDLGDLARNRKNIIEDLDNNGNDKRLGKGSQKLTIKLVGIVEEDADEQTDMDNTDITELKSDN